MILLLGAMAAGVGFWWVRRREQKVAMLRERLVTVTQCARQTGDNIAHDLRTPLTRLRGDVEAALRQDDAAAHRATLERTLGEVEGMQSIINALLTLGQAEAGGIRVKKRPVDLTALLEEMLELYIPSAEERQLRLEGRIAPRMLIEADRQLLARIFSNLLDNALKYVPAGGLIMLTGAIKGGRAEITVEDSGPGVPQEMREKIFERFTRLDSSRTIASGAGLGLSLVKAFARLLQGDVTIGSSSLGGAAFSVTLPASAASVSTPFPR
ncbi:MAG: HAMP domain-containing sensor histidine kinase [Sulfuricella sp.]|nr:HAMP domain-containing sensor histidine kinase [Sulfuricella sp.]